MSASESLPRSVLARKAVVYVRQSSPGQVQENIESQRRQYDLVDVAYRHGFAQVEVIDDDLGLSASGTVMRPGFERLVAWLCAGDIGAVLCLDASRVARNGRDWHRILELCGLAEARVIDGNGVYDPRHPNDRLLLGMMGTISEFELGVLRARMHDAARAKAARGELRIPVPVGYVWHREGGPGFDPDLRVQEAIRHVFARFRELGSARQVQLALAEQQFCFPSPSNDSKTVSFDWSPIRYKNVLSVLSNPFYAGAYAYGKSQKQTKIVAGHMHTRYRRRIPMEEWEVLLKDHHEGYIGWPEYERNRTQLAANTHGKPGGTKSARGGRALLSGLLSCARCGRKLAVYYKGGQSGRPVYRCNRPVLEIGRKSCLGFGGTRVDAAIAKELLRVVQPMAIEASLEAERLYAEDRRERQRVAELDLQKARYEARLAERRYAACDPDNRLIAAELEKSWEAALRRVQACEARLDATPSTDTQAVMPDLTGLAKDLRVAWYAPGVTPRARQRLVRTLIADIVADVDDDAGDVALTIHWQGGQHSQLRVKKPKPGEHRCQTPDEALEVMRAMAGRWSDDHIAASLNRLGLRTGQDKTWTARRVNGIRLSNGIVASPYPGKDGDWLTMTEAASELGVTRHAIYRLMNDGDLPASQVVPGAVWRINTSDLRSERVANALATRGAPRRHRCEGQMSIFSDT